MKTLLNLFENSGLTVPSGLASLQVSGLHFDSRKIEPGNLFVAIRGYKTDGHNFLQQAKQNGAIAALVEVPDPSVDLPQLPVTDSRVAMGRLAYNFYKESIDKLLLVGITGTNGKTTTSLLIQAILNTAGLPSGLIGTIAYNYGSTRIDAWNTTPESVDVCRMLDEMHRHAQKACVLEVSSHALSLHRVNGLRFRAAVFTNLSRDHMDFYNTEEEYFLAKKRLFELLDAQGRAVLNADDPYGKRLMAALKQPVVTFGLKEEADCRADEWAVDINGIRMTVQTPAGSLKLKSALIGDFNVYNILAAVACAISLQIAPEVIKAGIEQVHNIPGRLETYPLPGDAVAVIDYAHTPDALDKALRSLKKMTTGKLVVVFGCGGDRDRGKRPQMGKIAEDRADRVVVTTDNPRTEDPEKIIEDIIAGMNRADKRQVIVDRRRAIKEAVRHAGPGDVVLIAGKGHETYQDINGVKYEFIEAQLIKEAVGHV